MCSRWKCALPVPFFIEMLSVVMENKCADGRTNWTFPVVCVCVCVCVHIEMSLVIMIFCCHSPELRI
jgi:hypothetical protein